MTLKEVLNDALIKYEKQYRFDVVRLCPVYYDKFRVFFWFGSTDLDFRKNDLSFGQQKRISKYQKD
jgi:hypothetical protein